MLSVEILSLVFVAELRNCDLELVRLLLAAGADTDRTDKRQSLFDVACCRHPGILRLLLAHAGRLQDM